MFSIVTAVSGGIPFVWTFSVNSWLWCYVACVDFVYHCCCFFCYVACVDVVSYCCLCCYVACDDVVCHIWLVLCRLCWRSLSMLHLLRCRLCWHCISPLTLVLAFIGVVWHLGLWCYIACVAVGCHVCLCRVLRLSPERMSLVIAFPFVLHAFDQVQFIVTHITGKCPPTMILNHTGVLILFLAATHNVKFTQRVQRLLLWYSLIVNILIHKCLSHNNVRFSWQITQLFVHA